MLGFFKKIFSGSAQNQPSPGPVMASEDLDRIEKELDKLGHGYEAARLQNRAGDLYLVKGSREDALHHYGDAIDAYLQSGEYDNAMAVCRKIIRVVPEVIRTRRTLAWLCLGKGFLEIAREHIDAYCTLSKDAGLQALAVQHLMLMGQYVDGADFRDFLADKLEELGDESAASRLREGKASDGVRAAGWTPVVFAAMLTPDELRLAADKGVEIMAPTGEAGMDEFEALLFDPEAQEEREREGGEAEEELEAKRGEEKEADEEEKVEAEGEAEDETKAEDEAKSEAEAEEKSKDDEGGETKGGEEEEGEK